MNDIQRKQYLLEAYLHNTCTPPELEELYECLSEEEDPRPYREVLQSLWLELKADKKMTAERAEGMLQHVLSADRKSRPQLYSSFYLKAAAVLLPVMVMAAVFWQQTHHPSYTTGTETGSTTHLSQHKTAAIVPGSHKATLLLSNGQKLNLTDSIQNRIVEKNGIRVSNKADALVYYGQAANDARQDETSYNTLTTPRGGEYMVVLADGTRVWLNAASALRYPTQFSGNERKVELTGEAYFEVVHNARQPFIVMAKGIKITDLGTRFNINAYANEPLMRTTLAQGKLGVARADNEKMVVLEPGYQVIIDNNKRMEIVKTDVKDALAWKDGLFSFSGESLGSIMRKLSRWYDTDVKFDDVQQEGLHFTGTVHKYEKIETVLRMLELTNEVKFAINAGMLEVKRK